MSTPTSSITTPTSETQEMLGTMDSLRGSIDSRGPSEISVVDLEGVRGTSYGSTRCTPVDRALLQHLIHCERLLMVSDFLGLEWGCGVNI